MAKKRKDIDLLMLLSNEAVPECQKILSKHGKKPATDASDMYNKLKAIYFSPDANKLELDKNFAEIHPHKKWLIRTLDLVDKSSIPKIQETIKVEEKPVSKDISSSANGVVNSRCNCPNCTNQYSNANGLNESLIAMRSMYNSNKEIIGMIALVAVIGLTFHFVNKK